MEVLDCIYCELALNFDLILTHQQVCTFIQNSQIVNNVFIKDSPIKIICSLLQKRSIALILNLSRRYVPPYRVAFSAKESNILYIFV